MYVLKRYHSNNCVQHIVAAISNITNDKCLNILILQTYSHFFLFSVVTRCFTVTLASIHSNLSQVLNGSISILQLKNDAEGVEHVYVCVLEVCCMSAKNYFDKIRTWLLLDLGSDKTFCIETRNCNIFEITFATEFEMRFTFGMDLSQIG